MKHQSIYIQNLCIVCGKRVQSSKGVDKKSGRKIYRHSCNKCHMKKYGMEDKSNKPYRKHKKKSCEFCGFIPVHSCQLDVDHIDGNHDNDDPSNLQTLCANCHRLKTYVYKDWRS